MAVVIAVGRAVVISRPYVVAPIEDPSHAYGVARLRDATPQQLAEAARHVIDRHRPFVLDRPRCGWCVEPWVCSSVWLAEQVRRIASQRGNPEPACGGDLQVAPVEASGCRWVDG